MIKSLRWRLQLWYACLLLLVVGGFGTILYVQMRASKLQEIDNQLEAAALYLDAALRSFPGWELEGKDPPMPPPPKFKDGKEPPRPKDKKGPKGGPPPKGPKGGPPPFDEDWKDPFGPPKKGPKGFPMPPPPSPEMREKALADLKLPPELQGPEGAPEPERAYFAIWRGNGTTLKATALPDGAAPAKEEKPESDARPRVEQRGDYREVSLRGPRDTRILVGRTVSKEFAALNAFAWQLAGIGAAVLALGLAGGFWLSSRLFRPIAAMSSAAAAINGANLSTRIDAKGVDIELAGLAHVLNAMFDRLEAAFERQQQFTADASHELRTPLAILRANSELALSAARSPEEYRQTIDTCLRAANRMSSLVQGLLTLARADAGNPGMRREPVRLDQVAADCIAALQAVAAEKEITLTADLAPATVMGDADSLAQLVTNLVSNAIQHNHVAGKVHIRLECRPHAVLTVTDTGPGISEKDRPRIFERFFRVDKARARASGGTGLGLAICKAIADAHHAAIDFESAENSGAAFKVAFSQGIDSAITTDRRGASPK